MTEWGQWLREGRTVVDILYVVVVVVKFFLFLILYPGQAINVFTTCCGRGKQFKYEISIISYFSEHLKINQLKLKIEINMTTNFYVFWNVLSLVT